MIGRSRTGRPIVAEKVAGSVGGPGALVFGAIHGDEPESGTLCERLLGALGHNPVAPDTWVVPVLNPDGLAARTKNNAADVDLNRNFAARNWQPQHAPGYFPGASAESEPETRALTRLIAEVEPVVLVAVHQPFRCVNWDGPGQQLAEAMAARCGYPALASVGYPTPGSFGSRYGVDEGRVVITFELPRPMPAADWEGCLQALLEAARIDVGR